MARAPGPEAVPSVGVASDPGVRASPAAFGGQVGAALQGFARELQGIASTAADFQAKRQAMADATLLNTADIEHGNKLWETQTEIETEAGDDAVPQFIERSAPLADEAMQAAQEKHKMTLSERGRQRWEIQAARNRNSFARQTSVNAHNRQMNRAQTEAREQIDGLDAFVYQNPSDEHYKEALEKAKGIRENLIEAGFGGYYVDQWIGTEEDIQRRFFKTKQAALTDAASPNRDPVKAKENLMPDNDLGTISNVGSWLGHAESGGRAKTNRLGYAGVHQIGAPRLAELRLYRPGANENLKTWSTTPYKRAIGKRPDGSTIWEVIPGTGKWTGQILIPGMDPMTVDQFNMNPKAQMIAWRIHEQDIINRVRGDGLDQYIGTTRWGVPITMNGMIAGAHIRGYGGMKKFVLTGEAGPADENGTSVTTYMKRAAKIADGQVNAVFAGMSPADQALLYQQANAAFAQSQTQAEAALQGQQAQYDRVWRDSVASIQDTGQGVPWSPEEAAKVYGWDKVTEQQAKETRAYARFADAEPLLTMNDRDAERYVIGLESTARAQTGQMGYADASDAAVYARRKLQDIQRMRNIAPAEAALQFPDVREAYEAMLNDMNNAALVQAYIGKSLRVQQGFNLPEPAKNDESDKAVLTRATLPSQHLPDVILKEIAKEFEDLPVAKTREEKIEQKEYLRQKYNELKDIFGEYTDEVILEAYQYMDRNDGTAGVVKNAVDQIVKRNGAEFPKPLTQEERKEQVGMLKALTQFFVDTVTNKGLIEMGEPFGLTVDVGGSRLIDEGADPLDPNAEEIPEPDTDPLPIEMTQEKLLELAKEYARRGEDGDQWLDEQDYLTETQKKAIRARGGPRE